MLCYLRAQVLGRWRAGLEILNVKKTQNPALWLNMVWLWVSSVVTLKKKGKHDVELQKNKCSFQIMGNNILHRSEINSGQVDSSLDTVFSGRFPQKLNRGRERLGGWSEIQEENWRELGKLRRENWAGYECTFPIPQRMSCIRNGNLLLFIPECRAQNKDLKFQESRCRFNVRKSS